jgi:hypothetical protein
MEEVILVYSKVKPPLGFSYLNGGFWFCEQ